MRGPWQNDWNGCATIQRSVLAISEEAFVELAATKGGDRASALRPMMCIDADACDDISFHVRIESATQVPMHSAGAKFFAVARAYYAGHPVAQEVCLDIVCVCMCVCVCGLS